MAQRDIHDDLPELHSVNRNDFHQGGLEGHEVKVKKNKL